MMDQDRIIERIRKLLRLSESANPYEAALAAERGKTFGMETAHFSDNETLSAKLKALLRSGDRILIKGSHGMKMEEIFEKIR